MVLKLYNTLTRKKENFKPLKDKKVGLYTCGPTVYNYAHIGNLRTYLFEDFLKRVLQYNKYQINHVMNITDVGHLTSDSDTGEDKLEKGAKRENKSVWEIAEFYTKEFKKDIRKLNILPPNLWCKATDHIKEQVNLIKKLEKKGFTYQTPDGVYFNTSKLKNYGKLAKLKIKDLKAGARTAVRDKKNPTDFALWKFSPKDKKRSMEWESPWGVGFPGWHLECSAMSMKYLGETFDIHCGGIDHIPVHHTNEIAQSVGATGKQPVKYWVHGEFLTLGKERMGKSESNFITISTLEEKGFYPLDYRYLSLTTHYRKKLSFDWDNLKSARNALEKLKARIIEIKNSKTSKGSTKEYEKKFLDYINDDLNIPKSLALTWKMLKDSKLGSKQKYKLILKFDEILGLDLDKIKESSIPSEIKKLAQEREKYRKQKNYAKADEIRNKIKEKGFILEDTKQGIKIKKNS
ncbi:cysteine--tRNA ligase [archaeon]|nr:cysteine--tRNA ligase [archaeon]